MVFYLIFLKFFSYFQRFSENSGLGEIRHQTDSSPRIFLAFTSIEISTGILSIAWITGATSVPGLNTE